MSRTVTGTDACKVVGLDTVGITGPSTLYRNLTYQELWEHENKNKEGTVVKAEYGDTFMVMTGKYTGRSPKDKWVVKNPGSETATNIDWNDINKATTPEVFDELYEKAVNYFNQLDKAYVCDLYCGVSEASRIKVRFGVHMGDITHEDEDIYGDGVNVAARLEGLAAAGAICLSEDAYRQVRSRLEVAVRDLSAVARNVTVKGELLEGGVGYIHDRQIP